MKISKRTVVAFKFNTTKEKLVASFCDTESDKVLTYTISRDAENCKEQLDAICNMLKYPFVFCGYNNGHYDNTVGNYILDKYDMIKNSSGDTMLDVINRIHDMILADHTAKEWSQWKYAFNFKAIDLATILFSKKNKMSFVDFCIHNDFDDICVIPNLRVNKNMEEHAESVVRNINYAIKKYTKDIEARYEIGNEYKFPAVQKNGLAIGLNIFKKLYFDKTGEDFDKVKGLKSPCSKIALANIIDECGITFESEECKRFIDSMRKVMIDYDDRKWSSYINIGKATISVGLGGIHSKNDYDTFIPEDGQILAMSDIRSMFPTVTLKYRIAPPHLNKDVFIDCYEELVKKRLSANPTISKILKEGINGMLGYFQSEEGWMYAPKEAIKIRVFGELIMLSLLEQLHAMGVEIKSVNTDGFVYMYSYSKKKQVEDFIKDWQFKTGFELKTNFYKRIFMATCNDYFAETATGDVEENGMFTNESLHTMYAQASLYAAEMNLLFDISAKDTITDLEQALNYEYIAKATESLLYNGEQCGNTARYIVINNGNSLTRESNGKVLSIFPSVELVNKRKLCDIDYSHYIAMANKIVNKFKNKQLTLFLCQTQNTSTGRFQTIR